ncbi:MAG: XRE family transcriptional regulator, partial [Sphingomonas sp.]|nr:XRE family transcriptional regulator [Sphingomonas sp.]
APPAPPPGALAIRVRAALGEYRGGDLLWAERVAPGDFARALNADVLVPRPAGRFAFGRLIEVADARLRLQPLLPGARQRVIADAPWLARVTMLLRGYGAGGGASSG